MERLAFGFFLALTNPFRPAIFFRLSMSLGHNKLFMELKPALRYPFASMGPATLDIARLPGSNGNVVVKLTGKLSMETVGGFLRELRAVEAEKLVLDMGDISFVDSAGVGALVQIFVHCRGKSQKFALARLNPQGMAVMQVAGLHKLLPQFPTIEEACK
jgi:anti-anti-sigma factor